MSPVNVNLTELIEQLEHDLPDVDPLARISEAQVRSHSLAHLGDELVGYFVGEARAAGASWQQIGEAIGVSKQAAQQRWVGGRFERFTARARHVIVLAQECARDQRHDYIGTEHLLLGLLGEPEGVGAMVLVDLVGSLDTVQSSVRAKVGPEGDKLVKGHIPFTPRSKQALEESVQAATRLGHDYVGTEHVLLGLLAVPDGIAAGVLAELKVTPDNVSERVKAVLGEFAAALTSAAKRRSKPQQDS